MPLPFLNAGGAPGSLWPVANLAGTPYALSQGVGVDPATAAFLARLPAQPSATRRTLIDNIFVALRGYGLLPKIDTFGLAFGLADPGSTTANDRAASELNWVQNRFNLSEIDGGNLTFVTDQYWQGNGSSSKLNSNLNPSTATSIQFSQSAGIMGVFSLSATANDGIDMGNLNSVLRIRAATGSPDVLSHRICAGASGSVINVADASGWFFTKRETVADANNRAYKDGVILAANNNPTPSAAPDSSDIHIGGRGGSSSSFTTRPIGGWLIGGGFTDTDIANFVDAVT